MNSFILNLIASYGLLGIFFLILGENLFPPIPSEVILLIGGFFVGQRVLSLAPSILVATLASVLGAYILYGIGYLVPRQKIYYWAEKGWMKKLGFKPSEIQIVVEKFESKGKILVLVGRCIPIIRSLISIPAGMVKMNLASFTLLTFIGSLVWNAILVYLGYLTGENWPIVIHYLDLYKYAIAIVLAIILVAFVKWHRKNTSEK